jgi:hypothetical protein
VPPTTKVHYTDHLHYFTKHEKEKKAYSISASVVAAAGAALEGVALDEGASSRKMRAVILEENFLASSRKFLMLTSFPSSH